MKRLGLIIISALAGIVAEAQEVADSAAIRFKELAEIAVTAKRVNFIKDGVEAIPEAQEKSVATSGYSLLEIMKLPMLNYNPQTNTVSLQTGEDVKYYINGVSATSEEVDKILPKEVKRVEVLRRPMDPRYDGATGVVNFVVRQRDSGGYVSASFSPSIIYNKGDGSVFAKYSKGRWNYMAMAGAYYENSDGDSTVRNQRLTLPGGGIVTNNSRWHETSRKQRQYYAGIQAVRTAKNGNQIVLKAGDRSYDNPHMDSEGSTDYDGRKWEYESRQSDSHHSPYVGSKMLLNFANKSTLSVSATVGMTFAKTWSDYESEAGSVENRTDEKAVSPRLSASYMLPIGSRSELSASVSGSASFVRADYSGSVTSRERLTSEDYSAGLMWNYTLSDTWSTRVDVSVPVSAITVNGGKRTTDVNTDYSISLNGRIGNAHSLSIRSEAWVQGRFLSSYNTLDREDSPVEGTAGNMGLKPGKIYNSSVWYMWLPSNNVQLSFSGNWEYRHNAIVMGYEYKDGVIYNRFVNSGNLNQLGGGVNLTLKMLSGKLSLRPGVSLLHMHHTGIYPFNINNIYGSLMGGYILNSKWSLNMYLMSPPGKTYRKSQGGYAKFHSAFMKVGASYSSGDFAASLTVMPLYKMDHQSGYLDGRHINMTEDRWSATGGRRIDLYVKYTLNFGKKVGQSFMYVDDVTVTSVR